MSREDDGAKKVGVCFASNTDLELWTKEVEQGVIDNMIVFQPFPGAARTELESHLQRAVKVSAKGKHVKRKMDLERCLFWDPAGNRAPRPAEFARLWRPGTVADSQEWSVLFKVTLCWSPWRLPVLGLQQLVVARKTPTCRRSVRWQHSRSRRTRLWRVSPWQLAQVPAWLAGWQQLLVQPHAVVLRPASLPPRPQKPPWVCSRSPNGAAPATPSCSAGCFGVLQFGYTHSNHVDDFARSL